MGKVKIPYYVVIKGNGYWSPSKKMKAAGFRLVRCGKDSPDAWKIASEWAKRWQEHRRGGNLILRQEAAHNTAIEIAENAIIYPPQSLGRAFQRYRQINAWKSKAVATKDDWWRGWKYIKPVFGDVDPRSVTLEDIDAWRTWVKGSAGLREAHRATKIWRALWKVAAAMQYCVRDNDPSLAVPNTAAAGRSATWSEGEVVRLVKRAWRQGFHGMACALAVMWDTQLSPGDVRLMTASQIEGLNEGLVSRHKTGTVVGGLLCARTQRLLATYLETISPRPIADARLFLSRGFVPTGKGGRPYAPSPMSKNKMVDDFQVIRAAEFGPTERRQMQDMRRSGAVEAISGGAGAEQLSHAMGNTLSASNQLFKTYVPVDITSIEDVRDARQKGREKMRRKRRPKQPEPAPERGQEKGPETSQTENKESKLTVRFRILP